MPRAVAWRRRRGSAFLAFQCYFSPRDRQRGRKEGRKEGIPPSLGGVLRFDGLIALPPLFPPCSSVITSPLPPPPIELTVIPLCGAAPSPLLCPLYFASRRSVRRAVRVELANNSIPAVFATCVNIMRNSHASHPQLFSHHRGGGGTSRTCQRGGRLCKTAIKSTCCYFRVLTYPPFLLVSVFIRRVLLLETRQQVSRSICVPK